MFIPLEKILSVKPERLHQKMLNVFAFFINTKAIKDELKADFKNTEKNTKSEEDKAKFRNYAHVLLADPKTVKLAQERETKYSRARDSINVDISQHLSKMLFYETNAIPPRTGILSTMLYYLYSERGDQYNLFDFTLNRIYELEALYYNKDKIDDAKEHVRILLEKLKFKELTNIEFGKHLGNTDLNESALYIEVMFLALIRAEWETMDGKNKKLFVDFDKLFPHGNSPREQLLKYTTEFTGITLKDLLRKTIDDNVDNIKNIIKDLNKAKKFITAQRYSSFIKALSVKQQSYLIQAYGISLVMDYYHHKGLCTKYKLYYEEVYPILVQHFKDKIDFKNNEKFLKIL